MKLRKLVALGIHCQLLRWSIVAKDDAMGGQYDDVVGVSCGCIFHAATTDEK